ncbi:uncharacterized protein LOC130980651 [Arachis stenosperma]|uniref:uncharacterized protein LOC130980651 n=1 Tax=Arachis stenosperma TaxID=217475 RepID=UPI0025ABD58F|nr:uncharacterized protein LOC130980651 [Arachis stenosperma]
MSLLINGSPSKSFKMERDLRQRDPLSLFLFVLVVVEVLHRMVGEVVRHGRISPLLVGKDNIELSHLQFADNTILFCSPEEETICNYKRLLQCFEMMSGLSINFDKSSLIPAKTLLEDITSYSFTRSIWRRLVPSRVELFTWCGVLGYMPIINFGYSKNH